MSITSLGDKGDDDDWETPEYYARCNQGELNGMYLSAARQGDWPRIERLLTAGAQLDYGGGAALTAAIDGDFIDVAKKLIARGLNTALSKQEALGDAVYADRLEAARFLIDEVGADPAANDSSALFTSVVNNHAAMTELLLQKGANPHANKDTLLCIALSHKFNAVAEKLLDGGADPRKNYREMNAYEWAAENGLRDFSQRLRDHDLATDTYMSPGFFRRQSVDELKGLYDERQKHTGLYLAAQAGCFDIVTEKLRATPAAVLTRDDLIRRDAGGRSVLRALGESGRLAEAFAPDLWTGRKREAFEILSNDVPEAFRGQVDAAHLAAEIDRLALVKRATKAPSLKINKPKS